MLDKLEYENFPTFFDRSQFKSIEAKPVISVVGLGYVGAVSCACLSALGHEVIGVDIDSQKVDQIGNGKSPIHEQSLEALLTDGVKEGLISSRTDLTSAVEESDVTFLSVGTPTAADGSCDTRYIEMAAEQIGRGLRTKDDFHVVVMRCSIPPGSTNGIMVPVIERVSGKKAGRDFGVAFNPEFLREGVAVEDFFEPPKTVIGVSDLRTSQIVSRIFTPVDPNPIISKIEVAEMVKYVDNVWHAAKVCFGNEIGRLSKAAGVDGHEVMDIFVQDTKLNLSPYYLKPGFAFGGSCLPKEVRAMTHIADGFGVDVPMISGLLPSNEAHIERAVEMLRETGAKKIGVLGLAFKSGTDDLRESPILEVMAQLLGDDVEFEVHDAAITKDTNIEGQLAYVKHGSKGLQQLAPQLRSMLRDSAEEVVENCDAVIVTHKLPEYRACLKALKDTPVVDVARLFEMQPANENYNGIGW